MGAQMVYLQEPVTAKAAEDGGGTGLHFGLSSMQGWRRSMEDAHLAVTNLDENVSLFGVFDGHGGRGVSRFAAGNLPAILRETEAYKEGDYAKALEQAFLAVDDKLQEASGRREIEALDRPDAGAARDPLVVPRKVLQQFLGNASGQEEAGAGAEPPAAEVAKGPAPAGEEAAKGPAPADEEVEQQEARQAARTDAEVGSGKGEEGSGVRCSEVVEVCDAEAGGDEEEEEEVVLDEGASGENPDEAETEEEAGLWEGNEEGEDWDNDDMALVDPSRLTRDPTPEAQGCTAVVVLVEQRPAETGSRVFCANAGDSRAILSRTGQVVALSEDHKPENPGETDRIKKAGGFVQQLPSGARVQGDLNLSRAMGDLRYKKKKHLPPEEQIVTAFPEVRTLDLTGDDEFMVLGCDGIWERTGNQEMVDFVRPRLVGSGENGDQNLLSKICGEICDKGLCPSMDTSQNENFDGTGCDNMTVMIVQLKKDISGAARKRPAEGEASADGAEPEAAKKQKVEE